MGEHTLDSFLQAFSERHSSDNSAEYEQSGVPWPKSVLKPIPEKGQKHRLPLDFLLTFVLLMQPVPEKIHQNYLKQWQETEAFPSEVNLFLKPGKEPGH